MPYPPGHRDGVRKQIIQSARKLFNRRGFDNVTVNEIMASAGLTRGGFYSHFDSKADLYADVLDCFFTNPGWANSWDGVDVDLKAAKVGPQIVRAYLSTQHFEDVENSCPMIALPSDVARSGEVAKRAFEKAFRAMVSLLERDVRRSSHPRATTARAISALCVGGMVVARAINDRTLADELRDASIAVALKLGGWNQDTDPLKRLPRRRKKQRVPQT
jgi:TetR/AcrR family transcriptional regulator, transcriptional repressor for nem operon